MYNKNKTLFNPNSKCFLHVLKNLWSLKIIGKRKTSLHFLVQRVSWDALGSVNPLLDRKKMIIGQFCPFLQGSD